MADGCGDGRKEDAGKRGFVSLGSSQLATKRPTKQVRVNIASDPAVSGVQPDLFKLACCRLPNGNLGKVDVEQTERVSPQI